MDKSHEKYGVNEWRKRLRFLADIIFASAMTIMVFNIEIPDFGHITDTKELAMFLLKQLSNMWVYFIAFVVIAVYWIKHLEHFGNILIVNQTFIWFQLLFLSSIMLMPFWNTYISHFPDNEAIKVFLSVNMVLVGLFSYLCLHYAANKKNRLLDNTVSAESIRKAKKQILTEPAIAIVAAIAVFIHPDLWDLAFILVPVLFVLRKKLTKVSYFRTGKRKPQP